MRGEWEEGKKGEKGGGRERGREREKKAREEEERGLRGDEDYKKVTLCAVQSGVVFILKCSCTHTSSAPVRTALHLAFKASRMFRGPREGEGEGMPVKVLLQLCSCASDDLKICVTDVLQDHTNSTETELHQVCVCVCG